MTSGVAVDVGEAALVCLVRHDGHERWIQADFREYAALRGAVQTEDPNAGGLFGCEDASCNWSATTPDCSI